MGLVYQDISLPGLEYLADVREEKTDGSAQEKPEHTALIHLLSPTLALDTSLNYAVPENLREQAREGCLVKVPVAGRTLTGYIIGFDYGIDVQGELRLKEISSVESLMPLLTPAVYRLVQEVASRYAGSCAEVLDFAIPKPTRRVDKKYAAAAKQYPVDGTRKSSPSSLRAYDSTVQRTVVSIPRSWGDESQEHYIAGQAVRQYAAGGSVLILTPDKASRERMVAALIRLWGSMGVGLPVSQGLYPSDAADNIIEYGAEDTAAIRYEKFLRLKTGSEAGEACIVVGNRNSVFLPIANLRLIAMLDDAHMAYQEERPPYFHAREVALLRASLEDISFVSASIVPSLELIRLTRNRWLSWRETHTLSEVKALRPLIYCVDNDFEKERDPSAATSRIPERAYQLVKKALEKGPVLIQVGWQGYAAAVRCFRCRRQARCNHDGGPLKAAVAVTSERSVVNPAEHRHIVCSWCGLDASLWACPSCRESRLQIARSGAVRTAEEIGAAFKEAQVIYSTAAHRIDSVSQDPSIVVATAGAEPVAAEGYRAALLLDTRMMLSFDLMDTEAEAVRRWAGAAALVKGRAEGGEVVITGEYTRAVNTFVSGNYQQFLNSEYDARYEVRLPPAVRSVLVIAAEDVADEIVRMLVEGIGQRLSMIDIEGDTTFSQRYHNFLARQQGAGMWPENIRQRLIFFPYKHALAITALLREYKMKNSGEKNKYARMLIDPHGLV